MVLFIIGVAMILMGLWYIFDYKTIISRHHRKPTEEDFESHREETQQIGKIVVIVGIVLIIVSIVKFWIIFLL